MREVVNIPLYSVRRLSGSTTRKPPTDLRATHHIATMLDSDLFHQALTRPRASRSRAPGSDKTFEDFSAFVPARRTTIAHSS